MKKLSLQWRLTLITTLFIAIICGCLTMFVYGSGVYYMDSLQETVDAQNTDGDDSHQNEIINLVTTITGFSKLSDIFNELDDGGETPVWKCVQEMEDEWVQKGVAEGERKGEIKGMQKDRQTAIITMIELRLTKEQILTKYSEEDYLKAEEALNN